MRRGQRLLYELVCKTLAEGQPLRRRDYERIYVERIRRIDVYARDLLWGDGTIRKIRRPYYPQETQQAASAWVIRTLGSLVKMGALKVIPQIELDDIE